MTQRGGASQAIRLVCLDFQAPPRSEAPLTPEETLAVATEALPRSLPLDVRGWGEREARPYAALKVFAAGDCVAVSHAYDGGKVDEWDRPVLSARVALVAPDAANGWGMEIHAVGGALAALESETAGSRAGAAAVADAVASAGMLGSRERWAEAVASSGAPPDFLARCAHLCALGRDVLFVTPDTDAARRLLTLALALTPPSRMAALRACTACHNPDVDSREEIVFVSRPPAPGARGVFARVLGRPGPGDRAVVDVAASAAPVVRGGARGPEVFAAALRELLEAEPWPGLSFPEAHRQILACLEALRAGRERQLLKAAARRWPPEVVARMSEFVMRNA